MQALIVCLGLEPGAQTNPMSYGGTHRIDKIRFQFDIQTFHRFQLDKFSIRSDYKI